VHKEEKEESNPQDEVRAFFFFFNRKINTMHMYVLMKIILKKVGRSDDKQE
jgi:hypothetical protein